MFYTSFKKSRTSVFISCCYVNNTSQIQIGRITNVKNWFFERVIFPGQRVIFEAPSEAQLEIHTGNIISAILSDKIACKNLEMTSKFYLPIKQ